MTFLSSIEKERVERVNVTTFESNSLLRLIDGTFKIVDRNDLIQLWYALG